MNKIVTQSTIFISITLLMLAALGYSEFKYPFVLLELVYFVFYNTKKYKKIFIFFLSSFSFIGLSYFATIMFSLGSLLLSLRISSLDCRRIVTMFDVFIYFYGLALVYFAFNGFNPNTIIEASRNHVAVPLIFLTSTQLFVRYYGNLKISILPSLLTLFISFWSISRGSIIASSILVIISVILFFLNDGNKRSLIAAVAIVIVFFYNIDTIKSTGYKKSFSIDKFRDNRNSFQGDSRVAILTDYVANLNGGKMILGTNYKPLHGNFHNSYLSGHAMFGLAFLIFLGYYFYILGLQSLVLLPIFIRAFTDTIAFFNGELDFLILLPLLLMHKK